MRGALPNGVYHSIFPQKGKSATSPQGAESRG